MLLFVTFFFAISGAFFCKFSEIKQYKSDKTLAFTCLLIYLSLAAFLSISIAERVFPDSLRASEVPIMPERDEGHS